MNVGEFKKLLEDQGIPDDARLTVRFRGGMGSSTVPIESAHRGFDWTNGQLVLSPETELVIAEWYTLLKKGADSDATHVGYVLQEAEAVAEAHDEHPYDDAKVNAGIAKLGNALARLDKFQKQGF